MPPEPFQKGNSKEYVREWERIFRGGEKVIKCHGCGEVVMQFTGAGYPAKRPLLYCLACGEKLEVRGEE